MSLTSRDSEATYSLCISFTFMFSAKVYLKSSEKIKLKMVVKKHFSPKGAPEGEECFMIIYIRVLYEV